MNKNAKEILFLIQERLEKHPSERFAQALFNLKITEFADKKKPESKEYLLRDFYYDEDNEVLNRIKR